MDLQYSYIHEKQEEPVQMLSLIHAGPGCGKTWVVQKFVELLQEYNLEYIVTSYTGIACSIVQGADTISTTFNIPIPRKNESTNKAIDSNIYT